MNHTHFSKNGELLPFEQATTSLTSVEYSYGYGVYETIRIQKGIPYFLDAHIERLLQSATLLGLEHELSASIIRDWISNILTQCNSDRYNLKILLIGAKTAKDAVLYILPLNPLFPDRKLYKHGAPYITVEYERWKPNIKSLNMLPSYHAFKKAKKADCYDALFVTSEGNILEATKANLFGITKNTLITPPDKDVLMGVTRSEIIKLAEANGFNVRYEHIHVDDVETFDNLFTTASSAKIIPIASIDTKKLQPKSAQLTKLMDLYDDLLENYT